MHEWTQWEVIQGIRILLGFGFFLTFAYLLSQLIGAGFDRLPGQPGALRNRSSVVIEEECKLHARKLSECKRLGYHDDQEGDS